MQEQSPLQHNHNDESLDIREQFDKYFKYWPWFIVSVIFCSVLSLLYLRYTVPQYQASATILVKDEKKEV